MFSNFVRLAELTIKALNDIAEEASELHSVTRLIVSNTFLAVM